MKIIALLATLLATTQAQAAHPVTIEEGGQITCQSGSTNHQFDAKIYRQGGRYIGQLYIEKYNGEFEEDNDGDMDPVVVANDDDVIELALVSSDDETLIFRQVPNKKASELMKLNVEPSNRSRGVEIRIGNRRVDSYRYGSTIRARKSPLGRPARDKISCW